MIRKIIAGITTILALAVTTATAVVVAGYWRNPAQRDLVITLPPIIIPLILAGIGLIGTLSIARTGKKAGWMTGFCIGTVLYLICPGLQLLFQYEMIAHNGTGFWAVIMLPSVYLGIPLPIIGALLGFVIGLLLDRRQRKRRVEPSPSPYGSPAAGSPSGEA